MTLLNSYARLPSQSSSSDGDGVTFHLKGPSLTVPLAYYRNVVEYIVGLPNNHRKNFPKVSNPQLWTEALILMIEWKEDRANGFELELAPDDRWFPKEEMTDQKFAELSASPLRPGRDYIPRYFTKKLPPYATR